RRDAARLPSNLRFRTLGARRALHDRAVPAQAFVRLVARGEREPDDRAVGVGVEADVLAARLQLDLLGEDALTARRGEDAPMGVEEHDAGAVLLVLGEAHALDDALGLRAPVEED